MLQRGNYRNYDYVISELKYPVGDSGFISEKGIYRYAIEIKKGESVIAGALLGGKGLSAEALAKHVIDELYCQPQK